MNREKNVAFFQREEILIDETTGQVLAATTKTISKVSAEPSFIKVYYETMLAFHQIHDVPVSFLLSLSKFIEWSNDSSPLVTTLNKRNKSIISTDCNVTLSQVDRYIKKSVDSGLLFRTEFRGVYEVNPFMIAKGKWDSIRKLQTNFEFNNGKWKRKIEYSNNENEEESTN